MKKDHPLSVYFTAREKRMLSRLAEHCKRPQSDHVRWLVEKGYKDVFGDKALRKTVSAER